MLNNLLDFFQKKIWNMRASEQTRTRAFFLTFTRILTLSVQFFMRNKVALRASALTYYTVFSMVPVIALIFGIARGLGFDDVLREQITKVLEGHEAMAERVLAFADAMLQNLRGGIIAGVGVPILFWAALNLLNNIESTFNDIWGVRHGRSLMRKLSDYITILIFFPVAIIFLTGVNASAAIQIHGLMENMPFPETFAWLASNGSKILPLIVSWIIFALIYIIMPNTKVKLIPGLIAGVVTGSLYFALQAAYFNAQILLSNYNAIYGSFAALPLFLLWMQITWTIVLAGSQLSFAIQNVSSYEFSPSVESLSTQQEFIHAIRVMRELAIAFGTDKNGISDIELSQKLLIPIRSLRITLFSLEQAHLVSQLMTEKNCDSLYQIAAPPEEITPVCIIRKLSNLGDNYPADNAAAEHNYNSLMDDFWNSAAKAEENLPVAKL